MTGAADRRPDPEEIIRFEKDAATKIATITFDRPDHLNAPTTAARLRYAHLLHRCNIDDDVKVLVIRGVGDDFGSGVDLPDFMEGQRAESDDARLAEFGLSADDDVTFPPKGSYRHRASVGQWFANPQSGCRSLQEFKKISIVEAKGYCYGWHFYQAGDADLVVSSDDALFGHPSFRYYGWGPRMWTWAQIMGMRRFQEMVFTGRPFTADEMFACDFVNSVVPRADLEAETGRFATACARTRPTDTVYMQKVFFEVMKQQQGEYMGALMSAAFESMGSAVAPDLYPDAHDPDVRLDDHTFRRGLGATVRINDDRYPADFRLSKSGRSAPPHEDPSR